MQTTFNHIILPVIFFVPEVQHLNPYKASSADVV